MSNNNNKQNKNNNNPTPQPAASEAKKDGQIAQLENKLSELGSKLESALGQIETLVSANAQTAPGNGQLAQLQQQVAQLQQTKIAAQTDIEQLMRIPSPQEVAIRKAREIEVVFRNVLDPKVPLSTTYGGIKFELEDGQTYRLPVCFVNHINSIKQPELRYDPEAPEGHQTVHQGWLYRFNCQPVNEHGLVQIPEETGERIKAKG